MRYQKGIVFLYCLFRIFYIIINYLKKDIKKLGNHTPKFLMSRNLKVRKV